MKIVRTIQEWRSIRRSFEQQTVGFVPTMGYLHDGHISLIKEVQQHADITVLSIFVNPLQFGQNEDYGSYPRDEEKDTNMAQLAGVDYVFIPDVKEMYPAPTRTKVHIEGITEQLCGRSRPGHFDGVATVVAKLFNIIQPDYACFGQKDAQQAAVIHQLITDLNIPVELIICPTIREEDGLARSSRNIYLDSEQRQHATILYEALRDGFKEVEAGERKTETVKANMFKKINSVSMAHIDYVDILSYPSLGGLSQLQGKILMAVAVRFGATRLIDNFIIEVNDQEVTLCFGI
ncbi:pantoate--beta-alanine ligase [Bacillus horti]|uniref:Pantothenate synthetase n=1 Tax=Caldalkalibacillus horti TaxID=77523 RepID=A0ABT9VWY1_9BACI|nr:pantoate--beta-alanine ligase [Bacillus horti]MDQ0165504.1 pantoate--beta-alanine ligase [Bacillus horti]